MGMKAAVLAGGRGTRLGEATRTVPKPMIEIGGRPLLWHILKHYAAYGLSDFVIALGYKGDVIRQYFSTAAFPEGRVALVDTGADTQTGGRLLRLQPHLNAETFMLTWSDTVADVDLDALLAFHRSHGRLATLTAVRLPPRFGHLTLDGAQVTAFAEKPASLDIWINGAFFVLEPGIFDFLKDDASSWERDALPALAAEGELMAYRHDGFWQCMDTPAERRKLERLWTAGQAPWKTWNG